MIAADYRSPTSGKVVCRTIVAIDILVLKRMLEAGRPDYVRSVEKDV